MGSNLLNKILKKMVLTSLAGLACMASVLAAEKETPLEKLMKGMSVEIKILDEAALDDAAKYPDLAKHADNLQNIIYQVFGERPSTLKNEEASSLKVLDFKKRIALLLQQALNLEILLKTPQAPAPGARPKAGVLRDAIDALKTSEKEGHKLYMPPHPSAHA